MNCKYCNRLYSNINTHEEKCSYQYKEYHYPHPEYIQCPLCYEMYPIVSYDITTFVTTNKKGKCYVDTLISFEEHMNTAKHKIGNVMSFTFDKIKNRTIITL